MNNLGLGRILPEQYLDWVRAYFHGDLSTTATGQSLWSVILGGLPATALLVLGAYILLICGCAIRVFIAHQMNSVVQRVRLFGLIIACVPAFWLGLLLIYSLAVKWPIFPASQVESSNIPAFWSSAWFSLLDQSPRIVLVNVTKHLLLPAVVLAVGVLLVEDLTGPTSEISMPTRFKEDSDRRFIRQWRLFRGALRTAVPRAFSSSTRLLPFLIMGVVVVEAVFGYSGLGNLFYVSLGQRQYAIVLALLMLGSVAVVLVNLASDLTASLIPRHDRDAVQSESESRAQISAT